jgi:hypothetical protein
LLDLISKRQIPNRLRGWQTTLGALTERASGSPNAMEGLLSPQLQEMAQRIMQNNKQISRTFGPYGGQQTPAAMGQAQAGLNLPGLYANAALGAGEKLNNFVSGTSMTVPQGQNTTQTTQEPVDLANIAKQWAGLLQAGSSLYGGLRGMGGGGTSTNAWLGGGDMDATSNLGRPSSLAARAASGLLAPATPSLGGGPGGMTYGNAWSYPYLYQ